MSTTANSTQEPAAPAGRLLQPVGRRLFLGYAGLTAASAAVLLTGCKDDEDDMPQGVVLSNDDTGILNYAYALEQLEAAFYTKVAESFPAAFSDSEKALFRDIRDHEIAHRELFKQALSTAAIGALEVDFSSVNFTDRASVLSTARTFEDLGVSAYNGAGEYLMSADYLTLAGKIVSVEARHAAYIRDLIENGSFAGSDVVDANGLDKARKPSEVLALADPFIKTRISSKLP